MDSDTGCRALQVEARCRSPRPISTVAADIHHEQGRRIRSIAMVWLRLSVSTGSAESAPLPSQAPTATPSTASSAQGPSTVGQRIKAAAAFACSRLHHDDFLQNIWLYLLTSATTFAKDGMERSWSLSSLRSCEEGLHAQGVHGDEGTEQGGFLGGEQIAAGPVGPAVILCQPAACWRSWNRSCNLMKENMEKMMRMMVSICLW